jgi:lipopolysaccharide/colanic/teichoic acid biosynthesis glycosyltransferase
VIRLFNIAIPSSILALVLSEAVILFSCYVFATFLVLTTSTEVFLIDDGGFWHIGIVVAVILMGLYFNDLSDNYRVRSRILLVQQFCVVLGIAFLLQALLNYGSWNVVLLPKWAMMDGSLMTPAILPPWRILFSNLVGKALGARRLLFLGSSPDVRQIALRMAERPELGLAAIGYLDNDFEIHPGLFGSPRLGAIADLDRVVADESPDMIIVSRQRHLPVERLIGLGESGIQIEEAAATYETIFSRVSTRDLGPARLIFSDELEPRTWSARLHSAYSFLIGIVATVLTLPLMAAAAVLVKFSLPGSILSRQKLAGLNGKSFTALKFRCPDLNWFRNMRLDELPLLFNVLRGEMSVVGPRPERPEFATRLQERIPYYHQRHRVKPGITGWAQINLEASDSAGDALVELEYDLYYVKNLAVSLDTYIVLHTIKNVLRAM